VRNNDLAASAMAGIMIKALFNHRFKKQRLMSISSSKNAGVLIVKPNGRLDTHTSPEADALIASAIEQGETRILVDFAVTDYISSAGLRVLLKATKQLKQAGGAFALCNANEQIREVLEISGFATIMHCYGNLEEAERMMAR
jgi:anti-sigma B factor antagonist